MPTIIKMRSIDFETTGKPSEEDPPAICEVGWADLHGVETDQAMGAFEWKIGLPTSMLINPGRPMPPGGQAIHHISDEMVTDAEPVTSGFRRLMEGKPDFWVSHNAPFEQEFFGGGVAPWICTYRVALRIWPDLDEHNLQFLRYALDLDVDPGLALPCHRAGPDAYVAAALMARIMVEGTATTADMVRWSKGPPLLPRCNIGEHYGKKWADVPTGFLEWMVKKEGMDKDKKANAKHQLKLRNA